MNTLVPYGYLCITFRTSSHGVQTLIQNEKPTEHPSVREYHEITITNSDISIHGIRDGKPAMEPIVHDTTKWTTFYLEWFVQPNVVEYTYTTDPDTQGTFQMDQSRKTTSNQLHAQALHVLS